MVLLTETLSRFSIRSASVSASCWVVGVRGTVKASASECLLPFSLTCCGGAGTTKEDTLDSVSVVEVAEECTVKGNRGGADVLCCVGVVFESSEDVVDVDVVVNCGLDMLRLFIIFSSIKARTLILAVCRGGPVVSFFSHFLLSASCRRRNNF